MVQDGHGFLDHPETAASAEKIFNVIQGEGDRGALLVAGEMVSGYLRKSFEALRPGLSNAVKQELFEGTAPLATFSGRIKVAGLIGLISPRTQRCIDKLRKLRNIAAHSEDPFSLEAHRRAILDAFDLVDGMSNLINQASLEVVFHQVVERLMQAGSALEKETGHNPFATEQAIAEELSKRPDHISQLDMRHRKVELASGTWLCLAVMQVERDNHLRRIAFDAAAVRRDAASEQERKDEQ